MGLTHDCLRFIPVSRFVSSTPLEVDSAGVIFLGFRVEEEGSLLFIYYYYYAGLFYYTLVRVS